MIPKFHSAGPIRRNGQILVLVLALGWALPNGVTSVAKDSSDTGKRPTAGVDPKSAASNGVHWAFQPVRRPSVPKVQNLNWPKTPIDSFILAKLEANGLQPSGPASKETLLRRLTLAVTGLHPSQSEVAAFLADTSPRALEQVVDRLLSSPRYGERWGRVWLDLARYADTKGYVFYYEESQFVQPHRYRDWVIQALNQDLPYDRFLALQIAADRLNPSSTSPQPPDTLARASTADPRRGHGHPDLAAMGFLTLGRRFLGNPQDIVDDQLDTLIRGTQALTIGCARCHDHKFDPVTMADYYGLYGVLQSSQERLVPLGDRPGPDTWMTYSEARQHLEFERELDSRVQKLETAFRVARDQVADRLRGRITEYLVAATDKDRLPTVSANVRPAPTDINPYNVRQWDQYLKHRADPQDPVFGPWTRFSKLPGDDFKRSSDALTAEIQSQATNQPRSEMTRRLNPRVAGLFTNAPSSMKEVAERYGSLLGSIHQQWRADVDHAVTNKTAPPVKWADPNQEELRLVLYGPDAPVLVPSGSIVELDVHLYFDDPNRVALSKQQMEVEQWIQNAPGAPAFAVALEDRAQPINARILRRGDPSKPEAEVPRAFLSRLRASATPSFTHGSGRLELAAAIIDPKNPLTARVLVNRIWAHHFGVGLVSTPSDFGTRSQPPSHPELLDWLADEFVKEGWSMKSIHRLILLSAVFQQSADPSASASKVLSSTSGATPAPASIRDPENRWLHRFPRRRLDFEALRDSILQATGELNLEVGGKSFDMEGQASVPRRTIYGRVDRKFLPAVLRTFDFANPDLHAPQRHITVVPQQALFLLNSPWAVDRARTLARRAQIEAASKDEREFIDVLYRCVHQRTPTANESELGLQFLRESAVHPPSDIPLALNSQEQLAQVLLFSNEMAHLE
jgi:hypothetical protein